jgi:hypothetical protein
MQRAWKAVLKSPQSKRWRDFLASSNFAKRLECAAFSGAVVRREHFHLRIVFRWTESGAEVTAVQTLRDF